MTGACTLCCHKRGKETMQEPRALTLNLWPSLRVSLSTVTPMTHLSLSVTSSRTRYMVDWCSSWRASTLGSGSHWQPSRHLQAACNESMIRICQLANRQQNEHMNIIQMAENTAVASCRASRPLKQLGQAYRSRYREVKLNPKQT